MQAGFSAPLTRPLSAALAAIVDGLLVEVDAAPPAYGADALKSAVVALSELQGAAAEVVPLRSESMTDQ